MKSFRVKNLRGLIDTGPIELRPLTLLLGGNSSGKSSFLRTFPLLRQSIETRTKGPILWNGDFVDFGGFEESLSRNSAEDKISFEFEFSIKQLAENVYRRRYSFYRKNYLQRKDQIIKLSLSVSLDKSREYTIAESITINLENEEIKFTLGSNNQVNDISINNEKYDNLTNPLKFRMKWGLIPDIFEQENTDNKAIPYYLLEFMDVYNIEMSIEKIIQKNSHHSTNKLTIHKISESLTIKNKEEFLNSLKNKNFENKTFQKNIGKWTINNKEFQSLYKLILLRTAIMNLNEIDSYISKYFSNTYYIAPIRATAERYYRKQDLEVSEVDFQGKNLAMYLRNLKGNELESLNEWLIENFKFSVHSKSIKGHTSIVIKESGSKYETNLTDMGFGYSQILPILTQLWSICIRQSQGARRNTPKTLTIEQPELHLHPRLQALVGDALFKTAQYISNNDSNIALIIETHSEVIINQLGKRISCNPGSKDLVNIVLFDKKSDSSSNVSFASFDEEGFLENWPYGFLAP